MKIKFSILSLAALFIISCSSDNGDGEENASIVGSWNITAFQTEQSYDLNEDGESSNDLVAELDCYTSVISFTDAGTYSLTTSEILVTAQGENDFTIECDGTITISGTYVLEGNTLTTTDEEGSEDVSVTVTNDRLTAIIQDEDLGEATMIFERQ